MFTLRTLLTPLQGQTRLREASPATSAQTRASRAVWALWAAGIVWLAVFVARHGHNLPANDEWVFVAITYASRAEQFEWLGERHMEHRFPLARVVFLGLLDATGHDFRAGMWMTIVLLAGTAAALILVARKVRGHTALADAAFPFLFLHLGHTENLLMGYQIAFTITVFALSLFALLAVRSAEMPHGRAAAWGAVCLVPIALGGWLGLVFVPPLGIWVAWKASHAEGGRGRRFAAAIVIAVAAYAVWSAWKLIQFKANVAPLQALTLDARIRGTVEAISIGLGPGVRALYVDLSFIAWILVAVEVATAGVLAWIGLRRPEERGVAWGLLALLLGVWIYAAAIGYSRGSGIASRYTAFSALGVAVSFLTIARYVPRGLVPAGIIAVLGGGLIFIQNAKHGRDQAELLDKNYQNIVADIQSGMPIDVLARRYVNFWHSAPAGWLNLWRNQFPLLRGVPGPVGKRPAFRATFRPDGERIERRVAFALYRVELDGQKQVSVVRVEFRPRVQMPWEPMFFAWTDPVTGEKRRSVVRPWVSPREQSTVFWIDGPLASGELFLGRAECPIDILAVEYSLKPAR